jgi:hypothetical protein
MNSDLDAIVERSLNISAKRELAELRRIERAARALTERWQIEVPGPDDWDQLNELNAALASAVKSALGPNGHVPATPHPGGAGTRDM